MVVAQTEPLAAPRGLAVKGGAARSGPSLALLTFWLLPILAYAAVMALSVQRRGPLAFGVADLGVLVAVLTYSCLGAWLAARRRALALARVVACSYAVLITVAVAEAGMRLVRPGLENVPYPRLHRVYSPSGGLPGLASHVEFTVNDLGVRGPNVRLEDVAVRILCVGGSTTQCLYVTDKQSWPWLLQDRLAAKLGKPVLVGNAGRAGHVTINHDYMLNHYPVAPRFEWVIAFCGFNDMAAHLCNRNYQVRKGVLPQSTLFNLTGNLHRAYYGDLALVQCLGESMRTPAGIVQDPDGAWVERWRTERQTWLQDRALHAVPRAELQQALATYREDLNQVINTCRKHQQHLVLMTQPTLYRADLPDELERLTWLRGEKEAYSSAELARAMDAFNQVLIDVCRQRSVDLIDLAAALPKDTTVFYDDCHLNIGGCDKVADLVTDYFVGKLQGPTDPELRRRD
jgi:hypothetical protein